MAIAVFVPRRVTESVDRSSIQPFTPRTMKPFTLSLSKGFDRLSPNGV